MLKDISLKLKDISKKVYINICQTKKKVTVNFCYFVD